MQALLTSLAALWPRLPKPLRVLFLIVLCVAALSFGTTTAFLAWKSGHIAQMLGTTATRTDLAHQNDTIRAVSTEIAQAAAEQATQAMATELRLYMADERKQAEDTILRPMLRAIYGLDSRMKRIERAQKVTDDRVMALPVEFDAKLRRFAEDTPPPNTDAMLQQVLQRMEEQGQRLERIEKQRTTRGKF